MKTCSKCGRELPLEAFWNNIRTRDGKQAACKRCHGKGVRDYQERIGIRWRNLLVRYRMTREQYEAMLARQGGRCLICGTDQGRASNAHLFDVDHDHSCCAGIVTCGNCIRGLLCARCNVIVARVESDPPLYAAMLRYLAVKP